MSDYSNPHETCTLGYDLGLEHGRIYGAAAAAGLLLMALEIAARDRSPWTCGDCGREDLTWEPWCPSCAPDRL